MGKLFDSTVLPDDLSAIPEIDLSADLIADPGAEPWLRLGAWTVSYGKGRNGIDDIVLRKSFLLAAERFDQIADRLGEVGHAIGSLGEPGGLVHYRSSAKTYEYRPFHRYGLHLGRTPAEIEADERPLFTSDVISDEGQTEPQSDNGGANDDEGSDDLIRTILAMSNDADEEDHEVSVEPVVFTTDTRNGVMLSINPDLLLFLKLEERQAAVGIWWDAERGEEVLRRLSLDHGNLIAVEIRRDYLLKYLKARQLALVIGHYRHLHFDNAPRKAVDSFVTRKADLLGHSGARARISSWQGKTEGRGPGVYLRRSLHLWHKIDPPDIDVDEAFAELPDFDSSQYVLATHSGDVSPARFNRRGIPEGAEFAGVSCDFMDRTYFQQDVLVKYQSASGFRIDDDGSVHCSGYWSLARSTSRLGNELLATAIGDFAEGVPFHEWGHWKQYSVQAPSPTMLSALYNEPTIPEVVNGVVQSLEDLVAAFNEFAQACGVHAPQRLWNGSLDSLAGRQLKWVYPANAGDDEFLKRATLASTFVIDALDAKQMRLVLQAIGPGLHQKDGKALGSRNLLQRLVLVAAIMSELHPARTEIEGLVSFAEKGAEHSDPHLQLELNRIRDDVRKQFSPLAFLYDLRTHGGLAHPPNPAGVAAAVASLGLPKTNWHRSDYMRLANMSIEALRSAASRIANASLLKA